MSDLPLTIHDDVFQNGDSRTLLRGKHIIDYDKYVIVCCLYHLIKKGSIGTNQFASPKIVSWFKNRLRWEPGNYKQALKVYEYLKHEMNTDTDEVLLAYILIAFTNEDEKLPILLAYTYGRITPLETSTEWLDNFRLNAFGNVLNQVQYQKYDCDEIYTISQSEPDPIVESINLDFDRVQQLLVGALRSTMITYNIFPRARYADRQLSSKEICDECYKRFPFWFGGAHGCDVFRGMASMSFSLPELDQIIKRYPSLRIGYILNTATYRSGHGQHWVALMLSKKRAQLICSQQGSFDSFDDPSLRDALSKLGYGMSHNQTKIQMDKENCGLFSVLALLNLLVYDDIQKAVKHIGINGNRIGLDHGIFDFRDKLVGSEENKENMITEERNEVVEVEEIEE